MKKIKLFRFFEELHEERSSELDKAIDDARGAAGDTIGSVRDAVEAIYASFPS